MNDVPKGPFRAGPEAELGTEEAWMIDIGVDGRGHRRQAIIVRDEGGEIRAWLNQCRHLPIPLGVGTGAVLTEDRGHLICRTHGALYRRGDGYCVEGPCAGTTLTALRTTTDDSGVLWVAEEP